MRAALPWLIFLGTLLGLFLLMGEMDALRHLEGRSLGLAALISVGLLSVDLVLPIPSTVVMTFNGSLFGVVAGALVSLAGLLTAAVVGYWLSRLYGKRLVHLIAGKRAEDTVRPFFERFGLAAVVLTRPIPMVAEMVTCMAGTADMAFGRFMIAQVTGGVPFALGFAWAGAYAVDQNSVFIAVFIAVAVPIVLWTAWSVARGAGPRGDAEHHQR